VGQRLLTLDEVADRLRVSKTTVYRLVETRRLTFYKIGRSLRFTEEDVVSYINAQQVLPMTDQERRRVERLLFGDRND
jgi:excisionase family DNA binding protein